MIDIHSHILPNIDDGAETLKTSLKMAAIAVKDGITSVIATPHTDGARVSCEVVPAAVARLNEELRLRKIPLTVLPGYEIPFHLVPSLAATHSLAGSKYVLVEFPHNFIPADATDILYDLQSSGYVPVIAHPERNRSVILNPELLADMIHTGALVQITAASVTGELGPDVARCAHYLLKNDMVQFIATDSHSPSFRKPVLTRALKKTSKLIGSEKADRLVRRNPSRILESIREESASPGTALN